MTWRHHANTKLTTFSNSAIQNIIETKKNHLSSTSTSWDRDNKFGCVMPWRHDVTVSRGWVKSKSLNYILSMGPGAIKKWHFQLKQEFHHFFWSTLGWFCRQIVSRKSHRRNFLNLLPFKSYKQKSKSWVIPPIPIRVNDDHFEIH